MSMVFALFSIESSVLNSSFCSSIDLMLSNMPSTSSFFVAIAFSSAEMWEVSTPTELSISSFLSLLETEAPICNWLSA